VEGARNDPKLFGAAGGGVDHFRMAARQGDILFIANEENGKRAGGDTFLR
jgi:alkanesulfonate monooxygenase SsuD/methylene tetrahydromethanopterin reductase-like flavin-dependent oxidoreductase (luciferase family)